METNKIDIVVSICKRTKGLTLNQFCDICDKYNLDNEQRREVNNIINNREKFFDTRKLKIDLTDM